jgi:hypothetical protein
MGEDGGAQVGYPALADPVFQDIPLGLHDEGEYAERQQAGADFQ